MKKVQKRREQTTVVILFLISLAFYLFWYLFDGIIITEDAPSYIQMQSDREPGYCLYLWLFRVTFGAEVGLHVAVIGQCVIAAVAACAITSMLGRWFSLNWFGSAGILLIQYGITLLNRFVAQRRCSYFNSIETEGLAYSFWVFYFLCILGIWFQRDKKSLAGAIAWSIVLISIRKQMLITLVILFLVVLVTYFRKEGWKKAVVSVLLTCVIVLVGTRLIDCGYNWMVRGEFAPHTGDSSFILGTELYLADKEMAQQIQDADNRALFLEIMRRAEEKEYNIAYAGKGWQAIEDHYSSAYDRIKFDIVMTVIREQQEARGVAEADREADYNRIAGSMMRDLLMPSIPQLIKLFACNVIHGLITTVLKVHRLLNWAALFLYLLYGITIFLCADLCRGNKSPHSISAVFAHKYNRAENNLTMAREFAWIVLLAIVVNVCFTSLTIYCQMRYMLYNTGLFYQAWWIMLLQIYTHSKELFKN